jgi:hypothetical protein
MTVTDEYLLHGLRLRVHCDRDVTRDAIMSRLLHYSIAAVGTHHDAQADVVIRRGPPIVDAPYAGRRVYDTSIANVMYGDADDRLTIDAGGQVQAIIEPGSGSVRMSVLRDEEEAWTMCAHQLLTISLLELMKCRGRYSLHAGGVTVGDKAILIPGASGAGKSTLTAALLQHGAGFLSDDMVFLKPGAGEVQVFSFADQMDVTDTTAAMFIELVDLVGEPLQPGRTKHAARAEERFGCTLIDRARPAALVWPIVVTSAHSSLREADPRSVLATLAPNILLTDSARSQRHLDTLATLADTVPAYQLNVGSDLRAAAELVHSTMV